MSLFYLCVFVYFANSEVLELTQDISIWWSIGSTYMNITVDANPSLGWFGVGWKTIIKGMPIQGGGAMTGADMFVIEKGKVTDMYATSDSMPSTDSSQDISLVKSYDVDGKKRYLLQKLNPSTDQQDVNIEDQDYLLLYAWGEGGFSNHGLNRGTQNVNFYTQQEQTAQDDENGDNGDSSYLNLALSAIALLL